MDLAFGFLLSTPRPIIMRLYMRNCLLRLPADDIGGWNGAAWD